MKVRIYFCSEPDAELLPKKDRLGQQALETMYELVWEHEFKNLITIGKLWLKLDGSIAPFGPAQVKRVGGIFQIHKFVKPHLLLYQCPCPKFIALSSPNCLLE